MRDLFAATSVDYDKGSGRAKTFFATIHNKLVFAATGQTAAALVVVRSDPAQPNMGLTAWAGGRVRKADVTVAKNYLNDREMDLLNRLTTGFLDAAELRVQRREQTRMVDCVAHTDRFQVFDQNRRADETVGTEREANMDIDALIAAAKKDRKA